MDKGLGILEWTGSLVPQGLLVKGIFRLVSAANIALACLRSWFAATAQTFAGAKNGWKLAWKTMMKELAPQTADGSYSRPSYDFQARIGDARFPVSQASRWLYFCLFSALVDLQRPYADQHRSLSKTVCNSITILDHAICLA